MEVSPSPPNDDDAASQTSAPIDNEELFGNNQFENDDFGEFISTENTLSTSLPKFYEPSFSAFSRFESSSPDWSGRQGHFQPLEMESDGDDGGGGSDGGELGEFDDENQSNHEHEFELELGEEQEHERQHTDVPMDELEEEELNHAHGLYDDNLIQDDLNNSKGNQEANSAPPSTSPNPPTSTSPTLNTPSITSPLLPSIPDSRLSSSKIHSIDRRFHTRMSSDSSLQGNLNKRLESVTSLLFGKGNGSSTSQTTSENNSINASNDEFNIPQSTPWEPIRWSKLRKISNQLYSETAYSNYGYPTCLLPFSFIAIGMSRGHVLIFDYQQNLKQVLGTKSKLPEWGEVTSLATSYDDTFIAVGYSTGHIVTWELSKPNSPNIHIYPISNDFDIRPVKDGHIIGTAVIHLSFVDNRHSSLISGDVKGMVFIHDTVRNITRHVKTKRILGRYKQQVNMKSRPMTIFSCSICPIPESLGLVAIITPYLLVVVSIHPQIRTQIKLGRSKEINNSMGLSAALSWYPVRSGPIKLAYCWSNVVNILDISIVNDAFNDESTVSYTSSKKLVCDESIVAIQWINPQIISLITITQRLYIVNTNSMSISETEDLLDKHIIHHDYFSYILHNLKIKRLGSSQPAPVADAFFNSFRSYKGRLFLMGKYEFVLGSLSNWADRLIDIMESGDYIKAIKLATAYYLGEEDFVSVGLPSDENNRHSMVLKSLPDLLFTSLGYTLQDSNENLADSIVELTDACITATIAMNEIELLNDIFEMFESSPHREVFFQQLTSFIYDGDIKVLPAKVFKELVLFYSSSSDILEDLTCRLNTDNLDIDLIFRLCQQYQLVDTFIYITNCALRDFKTPLIDFHKAINHLNSESQQSDMKQVDKVYPYLSYILTGRVYPTGLLFNDENLSYYGKCATYYLLFSGNEPDGDKKYPLLVTFLHFNSSAFFAALNEGFEDSFLNGSEITTKVFGFPIEEITFGSSVNRQLIINILLDAFHDSNNGFELDTRIFLDIFIARNYPKYSQFILLPGKVLSKILDELCYYNDPLVKDECEVAVNSLLTKYKPPDLEKLVATLHEVKFYSILLYLFRSENQFSQLLEIAFESYFNTKLQSDSLFDIIEECLFKTRDINQTKERGNIDRLIGKYFDTLVELDSPRLVQLVSKFCPHLHDLVFKLERDDLQHSYLKILFAAVNKVKQLPSLRARTLYISLLAKRNESNEIYQLLNTVLIGSNDVELPSIVDDLISSKCIDSLVLLLHRQGRISEGMIYLLDHIIYLNDEYIVNGDNTIANELTRYTSIGIELCLEAEKQGVVDSETPGEAVWIRLIDTLIDLLKDNDMNSENEKEIKQQKTFKHSLLRQALSSLLSSPANISSIQHDTTIVRIFRSILVPSSAKTRTVGSLRPLLDDLFSAYNYQHTMLCVVAEIVDSDTYISLLELVAERLKGWRVSKSGECEGCGRKVVGVGVDAEWLYNEWEKEQKLKINASFKSSRKDKGKKKKTEKEDATETSKQSAKDNILVVFKCGHTYHWGCLKRLGIENETKCIVCD